MANENKMGYLPIKKLILQMSLPPMCSMFLQYSYNLVDSMFVANINENALAAVSLSFPITTLMISLSIWIGVGINVLIAGVIFNFVFDPLLIFGIGPFPKMGIRGAALATVLWYALSMVIAFLLLVFTKQKVRIKIKGFHFDSHMLKNLFSYGFPSFVMNALGSFMLTFTNLFLTAYSDTVVAFFGAYFKVQQMIFMTVNGLIQGCLPVMRFNYSAKQPERLKEAFHFGTQAATVMMIATYQQAIEKIRSSMLIHILRQGILLVPLMWLFYYKLLFQNHNRNF